VPELALDRGEVGAWEELPAERRQLFRRHYHRHLALREAGRLVAIDTANLVLDLEVSRTPALESFKRLHRYIDVLNAFEDSVHRNVDNRRRDLLLKQNVLADPDIERVTVLAGRGAGNRIVMPTAESDVQQSETDDE
jgi:hypothetical protein